MKNLRGILSLVKDFSSQLKCFSFSLYSYAVHIHNLCFISMLSYFLTYEKTKYDSVFTKTNKLTQFFTFYILHYTHTLCYNYQRDANNFKNKIF